MEKPTTAEGEENPMLCTPPASAGKQATQLARERGGPLQLPDQQSEENYASTMPHWGPQKQSFSSTRHPTLWQPAVARQNEAWFLVDIGACLQRGELVIDLHYRESYRDGSWGKIKRLSLSRGSTGPVRDPEDCRLIELLMGNDLDSDTASRPPFYSSYYAPPTYWRVVVAPAMYDVLLPRLGATGRLVWLLDSSMPVEEGRPLAGMAAILGECGCTWMRSLLRATTPCGANCSATVSRAR
jgi:hypothetical protein